ncbi:uncharacterized protein PRCAT00005402001 [Priceomyces carsonii]|uniref:uncharacterized protein n=1 Tax=Priceomyces carsonii TaxID=28549 RepID=UPI002EDB27E5|nr:unnamed protein product [Priceomyces carsonii]
MIPRILYIPRVAPRGLLRLQFNNTFEQKSRMSFARYASSTPSPPKTSSNGSGGRGNPKVKMLIVLGALVLGSTVVSSGYTRRTPQSAIEPNSKTGEAIPKEKISVIFVLGGPGSGKGTQCAKLVEHHKFVHLSAGDLLRAEQNREGSKYGELIAKCIKEGTIVPQEVTVKLLKNAIAENSKKGNFKFLVDGFPRKMDQALTFESEIAKSSFTLFFDCPEKVMLKRLLERGKTSGRTDDNVESIKKRFRTFVETSMPVVDYYDKEGKVVKISCDLPVDEVYSKVEEAMHTRGIQ